MKYVFATSVLSVCLSLSAHAEKTPEVQPTLAQSGEVAKLSEAFGHLIGKNIENIGVQFDIAQVIKGLQDARDGKTSPMSEAECVQAIAAVQEQAFKEKSSENLQKADTFLAKNKHKSDVKALEEGKVQYLIQKHGKGNVVQEHCSPLIKYTGTFLDGTVFGASKEEEVLSLDEVIPGLKAGLVGMKEGEKRVVYIHPDLAYGTNGYLPPNSLLTFEIEVVKADSPATEKNDAAPMTSGKSNGEIAEIETHVR